MNPGEHPLPPGLTPGPAAAPERVCRQIIRRHRERLQWITHFPELEPGLQQGLEAMGLAPGKGATFRGRLDSLLLDATYQLIRQAFDRLRAPMDSRSAMSLATKFGVEHPDWRSLDTNLTQRQWIEFRDRLLFTLSGEHRLYKKSQGWLFQNYKGLVERVVQVLVKRLDWKDDARQEGCLGLLQAIDRANDTPESLTPFARIWISRRVRALTLRERFPVHVPSNLAGRMVRDAAREDASGAPADEERRREALIFESLRHPSVSWEEATREIEALGAAQAGRADRAASEAATRAEERAQLQRAVASLSEKQRRVVELRYGLDGGQTQGRDLKTVASLVGVSFQQVHRREQRALNQLKTALEPVRAGER